MSAPDEEQVLREVRASLAFEHMAAAALFGGATSAAGYLLLLLAGMVLGGGLGFTALLDLLLRSMVFGVVVFLLGFAAAIAVMTPLYLVLEKNRVRRVWPFHLAAFLFSFAAVFAVMGRTPDLGDPGVLLYFLPGFLIVALFARRIVPLWRAADRAAAAAPGLRLIQ